MILQKDSEFLKEYENRHKPKRKRRFKFPIDYSFLDGGLLGDYFKRD